MKGTYRTLFSEKRYLLQVGAQGMGRIGDGFDTLAASWITYELTHDAAVTALMMFINFLPTFLFSPFIGVLAERWKKRTILIACDTLRAALALLLLVLYCTQKLPVGVLFAVSFCISTIEVFKISGATALIPKLLPKEKVTAGVAFKEVVIRATEFIGKGLGGVSLSVIGSAGTLAVDGVLFLLCALANTRLDVREVQENKPLTIQGYRQELFSGFRMLAGNGALLFYVFTNFAINLFLIPINSYSSFFVADYLHFGPIGLSVLEAVSSLALFAGTLLSGYLMRALKERMLYVLCSGFFAGSSFALSRLPAVGFGPLRMVLFVAVLFAMCVSFAPLTVLASARAVQDTPETHLARIQSLQTTISSSATQFGSLLCSGLAVVMAVPTVMALFAGVNGLITVWLAFSQKLFTWNKEKSS